MVCYLGGWSGNLKVVRGYSEDGELSRGVGVCVCVCVCVWSGYLKLVRDNLEDGELFRVA